VQPRREWAPTCLIADSNEMSCFCLRYMWDALCGVEEGEVRYCLHGIMAWHAWQTDDLALVCCTFLRCTAHAP